MSTSTTGWNFSPPVVVWTTGVIQQIICIVNVVDVILLP